MVDPTRLGHWTVARAAAGTITGPDDPALDALTWHDIDVPGTVAAALARAGEWRLDDEADFDADDWWFRCRVAASPGPACLRMDGLATLADVWWNGALVLHSENMFRGHVVDVECLGEDELVIACRSVREHLSRRRPRGRWKTRLVKHQQLRWVRTTLHGRMPGCTPRAAPVGPWRPVELTPVSAPHLHDLRWYSELDSTTGRVHVDAVVHGLSGTPRAALVVGDRTGEITVEPCAHGWHVVGTCEVPDAAPWFPHTHGTPAVHDTALVLTADDGTSTRLELGPAAFRTIVVDRSAGGFGVVVNGVPVFARGACWTPVDAIGLSPSSAEVAAAVAQAAAAGMNMLRLPGTGVYETDDFYRACTRAGVLVWQDLMFANMDYPVADPAFADEVRQELTELIDRLRAHGCTAIVCGGSEIEQQAAMMGLDHDAFSNELGRGIVPALLAERWPGVEYVPCSPSGGPLPFTPSEGVAHYYGVGAYLRPLEDARRAGVRFASECLAFANVPDRTTVFDVLRDGERPGHSPRWKARLPRDRGAGWDFEDVRDHYVRRLFGVDPMEVRYSDWEHYLDLGRAATAMVVEATIAEWRRPASGCGGAILLQQRDPWPGAGWGLVDAAGRPKSTLHGFARAAAPIAVLLTDEGLNGVRATVVNDRPEPVAGTLRLRLFNRAAALIDESRVAVEIAAHGAHVVDLDSLTVGFRDLAYAYRFGPRVIDVIGVDLLGSDDSVLARATFLPGGVARPREDDLGLTAVLRPDGADAVLEVVTTRFAQCVSVELPGLEPTENWFDLAPGDRRTIYCRARTERRSAGDVRAINLVGTVTVAVKDEGTEVR